MFGPGVGDQFDEKLYRERFGVEHELWVSHQGGGVVWAATAPYHAARAIREGKATTIVNVFSVAWATMVPKLGVMDTLNELLGSFMFWFFVAPASLFHLLLVVVRSRLRIDADGTWHFQKGYKTASLRHDELQVWMTRAGRPTYTDESPRYKQVTVFAMPPEGAVFHALHVDEHSEAVSVDQARLIRELITEHMRSTETVLDPNAHEEEEEHAS